MRLERQNYKFLARSHVIIGLFAVFLFYIATFFGTLAMFYPYIKMWESPSRHFEADKAFGFDFDLKNILKQNGLEGGVIEIMPPGFRDNAVKIAVENQGVVYLRPDNYQKLNTSDETGVVSAFVNELHTGANIPHIGMILMGCASVATLFLTVGGFMMYIVAKKEVKNRLWLHKYIGLWLSPYVLVFALTGSFIGLSLQTSAPFALAATNFEEPNMRKLVAPIIFKKRGEPKEANASDGEISLALLADKAREAYPSLHITSLALYGYGKQNGEAVFYGYEEGMGALSGRINRVSVTLLLDGGDAVKKQTLEETHMIKRLLSGFYFFHFLPDEEGAFRGVMFVLGLCLSACLIAGYLVWADRKLNSDGIFHHILNRASLALFVGVLPSCASLFALNWMLPFELFDRDIWIKGCFYSVWAFALFYAFYSSSLADVLKKYLMSFAVLAIIAALLHAAKTGYDPISSFGAGLYGAFFTDVALCAFAALAFWGYAAVGKSAYIQKFDKAGIIAWEK